VVTDPGGSSCRRCCCSFLAWLLVDQSLLLVVTDPGASWWTRAGNPRDVSAHAGSVASSSGGFEVKTMCSLVPDPSAGMPCMALQGQCSALQVASHAIDWLFAGCKPLHALQRRRADTKPTSSPYATLCDVSCLCLFPSALEANVAL
jgi:hypothetical protein